MSKPPRISPAELAPLDVPPLDPDVLAPFAADAMAALLAEGESANTVRSYQGALRYWTAWYWLRYREPIAVPVTAAAVLQFVVDHAQRQTKAGLESALPAAYDQALVDGGYKVSLGPFALSTVLHRLSVLSKAHQMRGAPNPVQDPRVRELVIKTRRAYAKRGVAPAKLPALTREPLLAMLATCDESLRGVRDRALLLFAWSSGGRRRSEVVGATIENTRRIGPRAFTYTLTHSKTNQAGAARPNSDKRILDEAADALARWIAVARITEGLIFRRVRRGDKVAEPLAAGAVRDIVRERAALAGLDEGFAAHSLRSGFVTEAARQNVPLGEAMALTGHASAASIMGYFQAAASHRSVAATLLHPRALVVSPGDKKLKTHGEADSKKSIKDPDADRRPQQT